MSVVKPFTYRSDRCESESETRKGGVRNLYTVGPNAATAGFSRGGPSPTAASAFGALPAGTTSRLGRVRRRHGRCRWRALPRDEQVLVDFDPYWFEGRAVRAAGKIYWHICQSSRLLVLDPSTIRFSYLPAPGELFAHGRNPKYRIGETPDGRLCLVTDAQQQLQLWVRGKGDKGWIMERKIVDLLVLCDKLSGRGLPVDPMLRTLCVWPSDMDAGRTGKVFIKTWGFGRFSFHMDTGKMELLATKRGKEYGHPMFAYFLAWPPAFLAPDN
ncbi:uncharacterized protein [Lolium perenne]|uniref:uncharacterized protein n=1 Tax=Lolium perenne TaxID=4522 RepID=UPI003A98DEF2